MNEQYPSGREFWALARQGQLRRQAPRRVVVAQFGPGERAAMSLAMENRKWLVLMDDRRPLLEASRLGLRVVCTPVLVLHLYRDHEMDLRGALTSLASLAALQTVSPELIAEALARLPQATREEKGG